MQINDEEGFKLDYKSVPVSPEEEKELFRQVEEGKKAVKRLDSQKLDEAERQRLEAVVEKASDAKNRIFLAYFYIIDDIKYKYSDNYMYWLEDIRQDAAIKLLTCIDKYDPEKNATFATYAENCIKRLVIDVMLTQRSVIVPKKNYARDAKKMEDFVLQYYMEYGIIPSKEEIMEGLGIGSLRFKNLLRCFQCIVTSFETGLQRIDSEDITISFSDVLSKETSYNEIVNNGSGEDEFQPENSATHLSDSADRTSVLYEEIKNQLEKIMEEVCTEQERIILDYRFGIYGDAMNDEEVAEKLHMDVTEVEQTWAKALLKLEKPCKEMEMRLLV